jgi:predicted flap endonuclease-1-like 5' DNA nuclease
MARAGFLEEELRRTQADVTPAMPDAEAPDGEAEPFAADADVDMLLRWRLLYLERRVAHLQAASAAEPAPVAPPRETQADPDRWKWRARYLEARVRHLEQRPPQMIAAPAAVAEQEAEPVRVTAPPAARRSKPPVLPAARNGAPDDLTLIEGVSLLQQTTLYSLGVFHFEQIAAWSEENVAWVDQYLRLQGRIGEEEWIEQASDLARDGPAAARRALESEDA